MSFSSAMPLEKGKAFSPLPGEGQGFVHEGWSRTLEMAGLRTLEDFFSVTGTPLSKPGLRKRYRAQIELKNGDEAGLVFIKRYNGESWRGLFQRRFEDGERSAMALREVCVARALQEIGIPTFIPLAWGWRGQWGPSQKSFVVMSRVPGESMEKWLPDKFDDEPAAWRKKLQLVEQLAGFANRLHHSGWFHRDFYLCHIFITESAGAYQLALVDLARMFRPRWRAGRWKIKDLAQLNFSAPQEYFSRTMRLRFAKWYFGWNRLAPENKILLRKIVWRTEKMRRRELSRDPKIRVS